MFPKHFLLILKWYKTQLRITDLSSYRFWHISTCKKCEPNKKSIEKSFQIIKSEATSFESIEVEVLHWGYENSLKVWIKKGKRIVLYCQKVHLICSRCEGGIKKNEKHNWKTMMIRDFVRLIDSSEKYKKHKAIWEKCLKNLENS